MGRSPVSSGIPHRHVEVRLGVVDAKLSVHVERGFDPASAPADAISRLKRDQIAALNSTFLHEIYFASLGGDGRAVPEQMASAIVRDFGSVDRWRQEFVALAGNLAGGC